MARGLAEFNSLSAVGQNLYMRASCAAKGGVPANEQLYSRRRRPRGNSISDIQWVSPGGGEGGDQVAADLTTWMTAEPPTLAGEKQGDAGPESSVG